MVNRVPRKKGQLAFEATRREALRPPGCHGLSHRQRKDEIGLANRRKSVLDRREGIAHRVRVLLQASVARPVVVVDATIGPTVE